MGPHPEAPWDPVRRPMGPHLHGSPQWEPHPTTLTRGTPPPRACGRRRYNCVKYVHPPDPGHGITSDPWPNIDPRHYISKSRDEALEIVFSRNSARRQRIAWREGVEIQKRKQRALLERQRLEARRQPKAKAEAEALAAV